LKNQVGILHIFRRVQLIPREKEDPASTLQMDMPRAASKHHPILWEMGPIQSIQHNEVRLVRRNVGAVPITSQEQHLLPEEDM
jgi:hypothetical protein